MIKIYVTDDIKYGPVVVNVKGIKCGLEWVWNTVQNALCYRMDGTVTVDYSMTDFPSSLIRRIVLVQSI